MEAELKKVKTKLSLIRFFDHSRNSRASNDDWNDITEEFDRYGEYSNKFTIHQEKFKPRKNSQNITRTLLLFERSSINPFAVVKVFSTKLFCQVKSKTV